jgi:hypothetical protein
MKSIFLLGVALILALSVTAGACKNTNTPLTPGKPGGGAVINSDSIVTAKIQSIAKQSTGYPWKLDVLIQNTQDVGTLPNPVKGSVNKVVPVVTDQDMISFKANDTVIAKIKNVGDVNTPNGISLYMYEISLQ